MSTYISLINYTQDGIAAIKERTDIIRKYQPNAGIGANFSPHHGFARQAYIGEVYKWVTLFRKEGMTMPWSEDYIWQLPVGSVGAVRTKTLTAFPEAEYREIIAALP